LRFNSSEALNMQSLIFALKGIIDALIHDLWPAIKAFFAMLCQAIETFFHRKKRGHIVNPSSCIPIRHPAFRKPDPLIYDQYYLMSLGLAVSWQNPDIQILQGGVPVASAYNLLPSTAYTIRARIWNGSTTGVCSGMPVTFSYLSFGVGTVSHPIGTTAVNLGVKGSALAPAFAEMVWITPPTPGHYCIQVSFFWADDANPFNNLGQENTQVVTAASPANFTFTLRNAGETRRQFRFEVDAFQLAPPPPCGETTGRGNGNRNGSRNRGGTPRGAPVAATEIAPATRVRNSRADNPLPQGWTIAFNPAAPVLDPGQEMEIAAIVTPDDSFHGTKPINVHAFAGQQLAGGVTIVVQRA
jgi:hypothetical protein